jgi:hypothetical protein
VERNKDDDPSKVTERSESSKGKRIFQGTIRQGMSRGSSGSIVSDYGLDDRGLIPDRGR